MNDATWKSILVRLEARGWTWQKECLYAPHGSMWLARDAWDDSLVLFRERMHGRHALIARRLEESSVDDREPKAEALSDVALLVEVMRGMEG